MIGGRTKIKIWIRIQENEEKPYRTQTKWDTVITNVKRSRLIANPGSKKATSKPKANTTSTMVEQVLIISNVNHKKIYAIHIKWRLYDLLPARRGPLVLMWKGRASRGGRLSRLSGKACKPTSSLLLENWWVGVKLQGCPWTLASWASAHFLYPAWSPCHSINETWPTLVHWRPAFEWDQTLFLNQ